MRIRFREVNFYCYFLAFMMVTFVVLHSEDQLALAAEVTDSGGDSLFENQIRSMTALKPPLQPSGDIRFQDNQDGTVADSKHGLMWKQKDSYQEKKEWTNWEAAHLYI